MKKSGKGFHWNLLATNGKVIALPSTTRPAAPHWRASSVRKNAPGTATVDVADQPATKKTAKRITRKTAVKKCG